MVRIRPNDIWNCVSTLVSCDMQPTYRAISDYFKLRSASHAKYYVDKAVAAGMVTVDKERQPHYVVLSKEYLRDG